MNDSILAAVVVLVLVLAGATLYLSHRLDVVEQQLKKLDTHSHLALTP